MVNSIFRIFILGFILISSSIETYPMKIFSCMAPESHLDCSSLQGSANATTTYTIPRELLQIYETQNENIKQALDNGSLSELTEKDLCTMSSILLSLIPAVHFTTINAESLSLAIYCWKENLAIVRKLVKALKNTENMERIYMNLQEYALPDPVVDIIAEYTNITNNTNLQLLSGQRSSVLQHLLPSSIYTPVSLQLLSEISNTELSPWFINTKAIKLWSRAMVFYDFPIPLNFWNDHIVNRMKNLLIGVDTDELLHLNTTLIQNTQLLLKLDFSTIQIRTLYEHFYQNKSLNKTICRSLGFLQINLLPKQMQTCLAHYTLPHHIKLPNSIRSLITVKQLIIYHFGEANKWKLNLNEEDLLIINKFAFVIPPNLLQRFFKSPLPLSTLIQLQSPLLSEMQAYYLSGKGAQMDLNSSLIYQCKEMLQAVPTITLSKQSISSNVYFYLLANLPMNNLPRTVTLLNKLWLDLAFTTTFKQLLHNKDYANYIDILPSKYVHRFAEDFINTIIYLMKDNTDLIYKLPQEFLSILFEVSRQRPYPTNIQYTFIGGLTCEQITSSSTPEFIILISAYNNYLYKAGKDFPNNLQLCTVKKLQEYLLMKRNFVQTYISSSYLSYMTESDFEAVGGYVLSALPLEVMNNSEYFAHIVKAIGKCSLTELMTATSKEKLRIIGSMYLQAHRNKEFNLFHLGNLTLFLPGYIVENINSTEFQLLLQSGHIDRRICANLEERNSWKTLIKRTFGSATTWTPYTVTTLGEMLVAVADELWLVDDTTLMNTADIISLDYYTRIEDWSRSSSFLQLCMSELGANNFTSYLDSMNLLTNWLLDGLNMAEKTIQLAKLDENLSEEIISINMPELNVHPENKKIIYDNRTSAEEVTSNVTVLDHRVVNSSTSSTSDETSTVKVETEAMEIDSNIELNSSTSVSNSMDKQDYLTLDSPTTPAIMIQKETSSQSTNLRPFTTDKFHEIDLNQNESNTDQYRVSTVKPSHENSTLKPTKQKENITAAGNGTQEDESSDPEMIKFTAESIVTPAGTLAIDDEELPGSLVQNNSHHTEPILNKWTTIIPTSMSSGVTGIKIIRMESPKTELVKKYFIKRNINRKISCNQIRIIGIIIQIIIDDNFLNQLSDEELNNCIDVFSKMDLPKNVQQLIWNRIQKKEHFHLLGKLIAASTTSDIKKLDLNLSKPWGFETMEAISKYSNKHIKLYVKNLISKQVVPLNFETTVSLTSLICILPDPVNSLTPEVFLQSSKILGKELTCNPQCLQKLVQLAIDEKAFGPVINWTASDVESLGMIVAGLNTDDLYDLITRNVKALRKISTEALRCIIRYHKQVLMFFTKDTISSLPASSVALLNDVDIFNESQKQYVTDYFSTPQFVEQPEISFSIRAKPSFLIVSIIACIFI